MTFEVVTTQRTSEVTARAEDLAARGVRRIFAVFTRRGVVSEWRDDHWEPIAHNASIEDPCLAAPLPVADLIHELSDPELRGELRGRRAALRALLTARGLSPDDELTARIEACTDPATLDAWTLRAATAASAADALA